MNDSNNKEINQYQKKKGIRTKHGFWKITDNGLLTSEGNYKYGRKHGLWKEWYANGQLKFKGKYSTPKETSFQNIKNELWEEWYENGQLKSKGFFHEGIEVGTHKTWHENGILSQETFYDIEKNLQQRGYFASPKKNKKWFKNGKLKSKGLLFFNHYKEWYQNGSQKRETINARSNSSGNGFKKEWYENNQIKIHETYIDGHYVGEQRFYENGDISMIAQQNTRIYPEKFVRVVNEYGHIRTNIGYHITSLNKLFYYKNNVIKRVENYNYNLEFGLNIMNWDILSIDKKNAAYSDAYTRPTYAKGGLKDGLWKSWWENSKIKLFGKYIKGLEHGEWKGYWENGKLRLYGRYKKGERIGVWKWYYETGEIQTEVNFTKHIRNEWYKNGRIKEKNKTDYYGSFWNEPILNTNYNKKTYIIKPWHWQRGVNGFHPINIFQPNGTFIEKTKSGFKPERQEEWNSFRVAEYLAELYYQKKPLVKFYTSHITKKGIVKEVRLGGIREVAYFHKSKLHGPYLSFYDDPRNNISSEGEFKKGVKDGTWKYYSKTSLYKYVLESEGKYKNGRKIGLWKSWRPGHLESIGRYLNISKYDKKEYGTEEKQIDRYRKDGLWKYYSVAVFYGAREDKYYLSSTEYYQKGKLIEYKSFLFNGNLDYSWKNSVKTTYFANGKIKTKSNYTSVGVVVYNEVIKGLIEPKWCMLDGTYESWYNNGNMKSRGTYKYKPKTKRSKKTGTWEEWLRNGKLKSQRLHSKNK